MIAGDGPAEAAALLHRALERRADVDFEHAKPPEVQIAVMQAVRERPGITVRELADELQMKPNNASALVTAMVTAGMLVREQSRTDRRVMHLHLTDEARSRNQAVRALFDGYVEAGLATLSPAERQAIAAATPALTALARAIRAAGR